jgi:His/Glu/Gln/Arg/opine family amino acid ABC transporter permease subunit
VIPIVLTFRHTPPPGWEEGLLYRIWEERGLFWDIWVNLFHGARFNMILNGLTLTVRIAFFAALMGWSLGFILALMRISRFAPLRAAAGAYVAVIRGIPLVVQLMIWTFVILTSPTISKVLICIIAFGVNSGAYSSEVFRAGILSVDKGQIEAGRSVGLSSTKTMALVVFPQAIKNALPALGNEFITLFKDTSIVGLVGVHDLTRVANLITSRTFNAFIPLLFAALIYLIIVLILTWLLGKLERRLRKSDLR